MALIEVRHVTKVFGPSPTARAARWSAAAMSKDELLAETGNVARPRRHLARRSNAGEIFVVMGLSGSGKSTLIRHLNRLIDPTEGEIAIDGVDVLALVDPRA